jgi:predicted ATPase
LKIEHIEIKGLSKLNNIRINLEHPQYIEFGELNITVLVGENGAGKTTLLRFLSEVFIGRKNEGHFLDIMSLKYRMRYRMNDEEYTITESSIPQESPNRIIVSTFSPFEQYEKTRRKNYRYIGAASKQGISSLYLPLVETLLRGKNKKNIAIGNLLKEIGYEETPYIEYDLDRIEAEVNIKNKYYIEKPSIKEKIVSHLEAFGKFDLVKGKVLLSLNHVENYPGGMNNWISEIKKFGTPHSIETLWFPKNESFIPMSSLSSGEFTLFFRFFHLIDQIVDNSIILIDEPETHLHPNWIKKYIKFLVSVFKHYKAHVFIATHSPLVVSDVPNSSIVGLSGRNYTKIYRINRETMGTSSKELLRDVFLVKDSIGDFTQEYVKEIEKQIAREEYDKALAMYDNLGDSQYKYYLFTQLEELRKRKISNVEGNTER